MIIKRRALLSITLLILGGLIFLYRYPLLHSIQQRQLRSVAGRAVIDNRSLLRDSTLSHHWIYRLRGIQRIWPHRVNSLQRLRYLYHDFAGFECDIFFETNTRTVSIGHDQPGSETFAEFLQADARQEKLFWLDVKNVKAGNLAAFCTGLGRLDSTFGIRNRVIIECYDTLAARHLANLGYLTAMNILTPGLRVTPAAAHRLISCETSWHDSISRTFPDSRQLNWDLGFWHGMNRENLLRKANDTSLLICLINVKSPGYR